MSVTGYGTPHLISEPTAATFTTGTQPGELPQRCLDRQLQPRPANAGYGDRAFQYYVSLNVGIATASTGQVSLHTNEQRWSTHLKFSRLFRALRRER